MTGVCEKPTEEDDLLVASTISETATGACDKCGSEADWGGSSWCPECGYYPGVHEGTHGEQIEINEATGVITEEGEAPPPLVPIWMQWTMGSFGLVMIGSSCASAYFHYFGGDRGLWSFTQLILGIVLLFSGQFWATVVAMNEGNDLSIVNMFVTPIEIWRYTFRELPKGVARLAMVVGGGSMIVGSVAIIGGIDWESFFTTPIVEEREKDDIVKRAMSAAMENGGGDEPEESFEDSLNEFADKVVDTQDLSNLPLPSEDEPLDCVVYGFMKEGHRDVGRLLLAASVKGKMSHVGELYAKDLEPRVRQTLNVVMPSLIVPESSIESSFRASWVKPSYHLSVEFDGWSIAGTMSNPRIAAKTDE